MSRARVRVALVVLLATGVIGQTSVGSRQQNTSRPNVLLIQADDLGYGDLSAYGQARFTTPSLDRLARDGIRFTEYDAGTTVCDATAYRREWKQVRPLVLRGQLTFREALVEIGTRVGVAIASERVQRACDERVRANAEVFQKIDPAITALTRELHGRGVRLATISNCMAEDVVAWPQSAFAPHFKCAVFSFAAHMVKPEPEIYLKAVRRLDVDPAEALYVGDGGDNELDGAQRAGLRVAQAGWFVSRPDMPAVPFLSNAQDVRRLVEKG